MPHMLIKVTKRFALFSLPLSLTLSLGVCEICLLVAKDLLDCFPKRSYLDNCLVNERSLLSSFFPWHYEGFAKTSYIPSLDSDVCMCVLL